MKAKQHNEIQDCLEKMQPRLTRQCWAAHTKQSFRSMCFALCGGWTGAVYSSCGLCFSPGGCRSTGWKARDDSRHLAADPQRTGPHHEDLPERPDRWRLWDSWRRLLHLHRSESPRTDLSSYHCGVFLTWKMKYKWIDGKPTCVHNRLQGSFD